jgi:hypothetical protein
MQEKRKGFDTYMYYLRGGGLRSLRAATALAVTLGVLGFAGPSLASASDDILAITIGDVWIPLPSGEEGSRRLEVTVSVSGAAGPLSWTARGSSFLVDHGSGFQCGPLPGDLPLSNGAQAVLTCEIRQFDMLGPQRVFLDVVDSVTGATAHAEGIVHVRGSVAPPTVEGVHSRLTPKAKRVVWGYVDFKYPFQRVSVYFKRAGDKKYRFIGTTTATEGGFWSLRSAKLGVGKVYVLAKSKYTQSTKSSPRKLKMKSFKRSLPEELQSNASL